MKKDKPIFIIGNPRSGTTLLRLMLTSHSKILIPPECGFAVWFYNKYKNWQSLIKNENDHISKFVDDLFTAKKIEHWNLNKNDLLDHLSTKLPNSYKELIAKIYIFYGATIKENFIYWGDKNNFYLDHIDEIVEIFSKAMFIHIVRDGRNIACSYRKIMAEQIFSDYAPKLPTGIMEIADQWDKNINTINKSFKKINFKNVFEFKYENLIAYPEHILTKICNSLALTFESSMLNFHQLSEKNGGEPEEFMKWKANNKEPVKKNAVDQFKKELTSNEVEMFNQIAGKNLKKYKYVL